MKEIKSDQVDLPGCVIVLLEAPGVLLHYPDFLNSAAIAMLAGTSLQGAYGAKAIAPGKIIQFPRPTPAPQQIPQPGAVAGLTAGW